MSGMGLQAVALPTVALAILVGLAIGFVLLALGSLVPATAGKTRPLWPIYGTELVIVAGGLLPFLAGGVWRDLALAVLGLRVGYEAAGVALLRVLPDGGGRPALRFASLFFGGLVAVLGFCAGLLDFGLAVGIGLAVALVATCLWRLLARPAAVTRVLAELVVFPMVPAVLFIAAARNDGQAGMLLLAFLLVETYDSYALFGGKLFGRRPAFPVLSPRKTVEGLAVGGAMLALTAVVAGPLAFGWQPGPALLAALVIALAAVAGDLAGSRLKRASGVKDYPQVLPRQGGLLDIVDAWLIAGPALVFLAGLANTAQP